MGGAFLVLKTQVSLNKDQPPLYIINQNLP